MQEPTSIPTSKITITVDTLHEIGNRLSDITDKMTKLTQMGEDSGKVGKMGYLLFMTYIKEDVLNC